MPTPKPDTKCRQLVEGADVVRFNAGTYRIDDALWRDILAVLCGGYGLTHIATLERGQIVRERYTGTETGYRWWLLSDNGGECCVQPINRESPNIPDVPLTAWGYGLDAGTIAYRIALTIRGESVDYAYSCPELVEDCRNVA